MHRTLIALSAILCAGTLAGAGESLWIEAEHLDGLQGYCWPMGKTEMKQTQGHWGLSGPGWAAEWNQGGESGFLSIATGPDDDRAVVQTSIEIPSEGEYFVWVRYGDWREQTERFQVQIEQPGQAPWTGRYGERAVVEEDNEMKLYWGWAFGWESQAAMLRKGPALLKLVSTTKDPQPRQVDVLVVTSDPAYRPRIKERPASPAWSWLERYRQGEHRDLEPLARRAFPKDKSARPEDFLLADSWKIGTFRDKGFVYLWNTADTGDRADWLGDDPKRVLYPYSVADAETQAAFKVKYGGAKDVPIFSDPRIVPAFYAVGGGVFGTDPQTGEVFESGRKVAAWLDRNPDRLWATMMNYHPGRPVGEKGVAMFQKYRDRYVGSIAGESLGYFDADPAALKAAVTAAQNRRQLADAFGPLFVAANAAKYRTIYGRDLDANPFADVISCLSVGNITFAPLLSKWGSRTLGYESAAATSTVLGMRWAFMRGIARQGGHTTATYRSCNFGDSATIFSNQGSYHTPQNIYDNYYSVYSGAGMTWYKMDLWYQYMAGSSMFYHEQGFDEFWRPGGLTAAGIRDVELSPKGKLVDRFLRVTAAHPDRGHPFTPVAILVDSAHGWEPSPYWPNSFKNFHQQPDRFRFGDHERMLQEYLWTAFHPIGPESEKPMTGTNEVYVPGVFGDLFDVVAADPDVARWTTLDTYPVVIVAGDIELTAAEGRRLAEYVSRGGTLLVADAHLTGPGLAELKLPVLGEPQEADSFRWLNDPAVEPSPRFRYRPIDATGGRVLATAGDGRPCCAAFDRDAGRLIVLSIPRGLSITRQAVPLVPRLFAHLSRGLMPVEVTGDVEWLVNRTQTGWIVTLLNPAGQAKPQQGITPTDYRQNRPVTIRSRVPIATASDWLLPDDPLTVKDGSISFEVPAGGVRIVELR